MSKCLIAWNLKNVRNALRKPKKKGAPNQTSLIKNLVLARPGELKEGEEAESRSMENKKAGTKKKMTSLTPDQSLGVNWGKKPISSRGSEKQTVTSAERIIEGRGEETVIGGTGPTGEKGGPKEHKLQKGKGSRVPEKGPFDLNSSQSKVRIVGGQKSGIKLTHNLLSSLSSEIVGGTGRGGSI